jgi:hypothetical protein
VLEEEWQRSAYRANDDLVFGHPTKGTPVNTSKLAKRYLKSALARARIEQPFRPFHDLCNPPSLTHGAAAGNPPIYVQARAGHSRARLPSGTCMRRRCFPGAAERSEPTDVRPVAVHAPQASRR